MRRLYLQIYAAFLGILLLFGVLVTVASLLIPVHPQDPLLLDELSTVLNELLPGLDRPVDELQAAVARLGRLFPINLTVRSPDGVLLAAVGPPLPTPPPERMAYAWWRAGSRGIAPSAGWGRWACWPSPLR